MALADFQRAVCDLIASPRLCIALRTDPASILGRYVLSEREQRRLTSIVWQRGMSTSCSLYRSNRITPICTLLIFTCFVLQETLFETLDHFLRATELFDAQYMNEVERFGRFLMRRLQSNEIANRFLEEALQYELAATTLEFSSRRRILKILSGLPRATPGKRLRLNPLIKIVRFRHDPGIVLKALKSFQMPPDDVPEGDFFVILSIVTGELEVMRVAGAIGNAFQALEKGQPLELSADEAETLIEAQVLVSGEGAGVTE